jgi:hypothetical protein
MVQIFTVLFAYTSLNSTFVSTGWSPGMKDGIFPVAPTKTKEEFITDPNPPCGPRCYKFLQDNEQVRILLLTFRNNIDLWSYARRRYLCGRARKRSTSTPFLWSHQIFSLAILQSCCKLTVAKYGGTYDIYAIPLIFHSSGPH